MVVEKDVGKLDVFWDMQEQYDLESPSQFGRLDVFVCNNYCDDLPHDLSYYS